MQSMSIQGTEEMENENKVEIKKIPDNCVSRAT